MRFVFAIAACLIPASVNAGGCFQSSKCFQKAQVVKVVKEYPVVQKVKNINLYAATPGYYNAAIGQANMAALIREQSRLTEQTQRLQEWYAQQQQYQPMQQYANYQPPQQYQPPQYAPPQQQQPCPTCQPQQQCEGGQCEAPGQQPPQPPFQQQQRPSAIQRNCAECHQNGNRKGDVDLSDPRNLPPDTRDRLFEAVRNGDMPKGGDPLSAGEKLRVLLEADEQLAGQLANELGL